MCISASAINIQIFESNAVFCIHIRFVRDVYVCDDQRKETEMKNTFNILFMFLNAS